MREVVRDRAPGFLFKQIQHDEILIFAGKKKTGDIDGLPLPQGRALIEHLVVLERQDGQRDRLVESVFRKQRSEDGPHLLEAQCNFAPAFFARVGDDSEVRGVKFQPGRFGRECVRAQQGCSTKRGYQS